MRGEFGRGAVAVLPLIRFLGPLPDPDHAEAANAVTRITGGNFRLIERLMTQIARVIDINQLDHVSPDVVHPARQMLVIGTSQVSESG